MIRFTPLLIAAFAFSSLATADVDLYVSTTGNDRANDGSIGAPFATLSKATATVRAALTTASEPINVWVRGGTYYLEQTLEFSSADSGTVATPVTYSAYADETVVISGAMPLAPSWSTYSGNIQVATIGSGLVFDMLFVDGAVQVMARYPDYDPDVAILNGFASDASSASRAALWSNPSTGFVRGLHGNRWGGNSFKITGLSSNGSPNLEWVGDNNRGSGLHGEYRMVENLFEELDAPGEWFYDEPDGKLYFYPPSDVDPAAASFEGASLEELIRVVGSAEEKVKYLTFTKFTFTHTHRTLFTRDYEPMNRSDWRLVRAGAIFIQDAEDITISDSVFDEIGGNGVFMSAYNRNHLITNNEFINNGATCVNVCGSKTALWDVNEWDDHVTDVADIDINTEVGPKTDDYPKDITISYNHMSNMGRFEKQTAGVNLFLAESITVSHNTIHRSPRSGINICDGAWGGHIIEFNDVFDCIRETNDHGPFNSWGRDRFYSIGGYNHNGSDGETKRPYAFLEAWKTTHIRNNRFHYDEPTEFGIDLDDGSSNYEIYNNLILNTSVKLREGFGRKVYNNIMINRGLDLHVWYNECRDELYNNIIVATSAYNPINVGSAAEEASTDYNLFYNNGEDVIVNSFSWTAGSDEHSVTANPLFTDVNNLDYTVKAGSPALELGFVNFPMDQFGKPGAPEPEAIEYVFELPAESDAEPLMGAYASSIYSVSIQSSLGSPDLDGIYFEVLPPGTYAASQGFEEGDAIRSVNGAVVTTKQSFWLAYHAIEPGTEISIDLLRNQEVIPFTFTKPSVGEELNDTAGIVYTGDWEAAEDFSSFNEDIRFTNTANDVFELTFYGTGIAFTSQNDSDMGLVDVTVDGALDETIDLYSATQIHGQTVYDRTGLSSGIHTLRVVNKEDKVLILDSFTVELRRSLSESIVVAASGSSDAPQVSGSDLAQIEYFSSSATGGDELITQHAELFNGEVGNEDGDTSDAGEVRLSSANALTITFDTSVNALGYDVTRINSYFGWGTDGGGRSNQGYGLRFDYVDGTSESIAASHWAPNSPAEYWTTVSFTNIAGGAITTGVKAITFDFSNNANASGVLIGREIDIFGVPSSAGDIPTPVGHWKLDEVSGAHVADASGNGFHATVSNEKWVAGLDGAGLDFNGTSTTVTLPATAFTYVNYEITLAMWVFGGEDQPKDNSIFYANAGAINRVLNIHLPWSSAEVSWDAGNVGSGYDRIDKVATSDEIKGQWNHWVFTKDANLGEMKIYLNGALWHNGTRRTAPMLDISEVSLGSNMGGGDFYSGVVDDVCLYYSALDPQEVGALYASYSVANGVPQVWLYEQGLETTDAGALSNFDGDSMPAWQEYYAGTDPWDSLAVLSAEVADISEGGFNVQWPSVPGKTYDVWFNPTLLESDWELAKEGIEGDNSIISVWLETDLERGFVKVSVR